MTDNRVQQALFGYSKGHRMLASSVSIPSEVARTLRGVTDTVVERRDSRYLTIMPLPEMGAQVFIQTWMAEDRLRPGSVWSHALFVDFLTLAEATTLAPLFAMFRRPLLEDDGTVPPLGSYEVELDGHALLDEGAEPLPTSELDFQFAENVLRQLYGSTERVTVQVPDAGSIQATLLALYEQQWPRLRRSFALRTRLRASEASTTFDLEVVERGRSRAPETPDQAPWLPVLLDDLRVSGGGEFRLFLRSFASEAGQGRRAMPSLALAFRALFSSSPEDAIAEICKTFPDSRSMRALKRALLGHPTSSSPIPASWPTGELDRLALLFAASPTALDFKDLKVGERLAAALRDAPTATVTALRGLNLEALSPSQVEIMLPALAQKDDHSFAAMIATEQPDLGVLLAAQQPALLGLPDLWNVPDPDLLVEVFQRAGASVQREVLQSLVHDRAVGPLVLLCTAEPSLWWDMLLASAGGSAGTNGIVVDGAVLGQVLARVGAASIGVPPREFATDDELLGVLASADLSAGLWRRPRAEGWLRLWRRTVSDEGAVPPPLRDKLCAVALLSAMNSGSRELRSDAWRLTFPRLHERLADAGFDDQAWALLSSSLPDAPDWDRCLRLRRGALGELRRDRWGEAEVSALLEDVAPYREEMLRELRASAPRKKSKGWLRQIVDSLLP